MPVTIWIPKKLIAVLKQDAEKMRTYFREDAYVNWHCTNEHFTVEEYIRANCEYPGEWDGTVERIEKMNDLTVAAVNVYARDRSASLRRFFLLENRGTHRRPVRLQAQIFRISHRVLNPLIGLSCGWRKIKYARWMNIGETTGLHRSGDWTRRLVLPSIDCAL